MRTQLQPKPYLSVFKRLIFQKIHMFSKINCFLKFYDVSQKKKQFMWIHLKLFIPFNNHLINNQTLLWNKSKQICLIFVIIEKTMPPSVINWSGLHCQ